MKGLLVKDILVLRKYLKLMGTFFLVYFGMSVLMDESAISLFGFTLVLCTIIVAVTSFAYDDQAKWDQYCRALPVAPAKVVGSKYILLGAFGLLGFCLALLLGLVGSFVTGNAFSLPGAAAALGMMLLGGMLLAAFLIPLVIRFGMEKARIALMLVIVLPSVVLAIVSRAGVPLPSEAEIQKLFPLIVVGVLALIALSYRVSVRIYNRKFK